MDFPSRKNLLESWRVSLLASILVPELRLLLWASLDNSGHSEGSRPGYFHPVQEAHGASWFQHCSPSTLIAVPLLPPCWCLRTTHLACSLASFLPRHRPQHESYVSCTPPLAWPVSPKDCKSHTCQPLISTRIQPRPCWLFQREGTVQKAFPQMAEKR